MEEDELEGEKIEKEGLTSNFFYSASLETAAGGLSTVWWAFARLFGCYNWEEEFIIGSVI